MQMMPKDTVSDMATAGKESQLYTQEPPPTSGIGLHLEASGS